MSERCCEFCNTALVQRENETNYRFRQRRFCGLRCAAASAHKGHTEPVRHCKKCGEQFFRREKERRADFRIRVYCSPVCVSAGIAENVAKLPRRSAKKRAPENGSGWKALKREEWNRRHAPRDVRFPGASSVEAFLAAGGSITQCAPAFVAPVQGAIDDETAAKRLKKMKLTEHVTESWKAQRDSARAQIGRQ